MKILIVNTLDIHGGAARAANRLHQALLAKNINSKILVQTKSSDDFTVLSPESKVDNIINRLKTRVDALPVLFYKNKSKTLFSPSWAPSHKIIDRINEQNPDVVHLHWINFGMIRIEDLVKIKAPIIWSLHDNWAFTGGCHIKWECNKYKDACGACPSLGSQNINDLSRKIWKRKNKTYSKLTNITIVGLSKWINDCSQESSLLGKKPHINLPNLINTNTYKKIDKNKARELWSLPQNKKLILFGAMNATSDVNKGFTELSAALLKIRREDIEFVVFGSSMPSDPPELGCKVHYIGRLSDDISLVTLYNAVDVMVVPSKQENLSNAIMESLACGTPVVGFDVGGNSDLITHEKNGYLAKPFETLDLANGIQWILDNERYEELCINARNKVMRDFDSKVVVNQYIDLYHKVLKDNT